MYSIDETITYTYALLSLSIHLLADPFIQRSHPHLWLFGPILSHACPAIFCAQGFCTRLAKNTASWEPKWGTSHPFFISGLSLDTDMAIMAWTQVWDTLKSWLIRVTCLDQGFKLEPQKLLSGSEVVHCMSVILPDWQARVSAEMLEFTPVSWNLGFWILQKFHGFLPLHKRRSTGHADPGRWISLPRSKSKRLFHGRHVFVVNVSIHRQLDSRNISLPRSKSKSFATCWLLDCTDFELWCPGCCSSDQLKDWGCYGKDASMLVFSWSLKILLQPLWRMRAFKGEYKFGGPPHCVIDLHIYDDFLHEQRQSYCRHKTCS